MRRPSFQFYPADWLGNSNLRRCTHAEKGVWVDVLCLMHDSQEYGLLRWPLAEIAQAVGCQLQQLQSLISKGVMKGADTGERCESFVYVPRTARKDGEPVTLIPEQPGPVWYSSRMVRDEHVRQHRGEASRFPPKDSPSGDPPKPTPKLPFGDALDDHPTTHPAFTGDADQSGTDTDQGHKSAESGKQGADSAETSAIRSPKPPFGDGSSSSSSSSSSKGVADKPPPTKEVTFSTWLESIKAAGEKAITDHKSLWEYSHNIGLPEDWVWLAWRQFRRRYESDPRYRGKRYKEWRQVFLSAVKENWFKLWVAVDDGYRLTTQGFQAQREVEAQTSQEGAA